MSLADRIAFKLATSLGYDDEKRQVMAYGLGAFIQMMQLLLIAFLFGLVFGLINALFTIGPFNLINKLIGALFGLIMAALLVWGAVAVFNLIVGTGVFDSAEWYINLEGGPIFRFFDTYGPLDMLFGF